MSLKILTLVAAMIGSPVCAEAKGIPGPLRCRRRAKEVARALRDLAEPPRDQIGVPQKFLVPLEGARFARWAHTLTLRTFRMSIQVSLDGAEVAVVNRAAWPPGLPSVLAEKLRPLWRRRRETNPDKKLARKVLLLVEPSTRWEVTARLLRDLATIAVRHVGMLVAVSDPTPPIPPSRATADLRALIGQGAADADPSQKVPQLDRKSTPIERRVEAHWQRATADCPQIKRIYEPMRDLPPPLSVDVASQILEEALVACGCRADVDTVHAALHLRFHQPPTGVVWFRYNAAGPPVARPQHEPWRLTVARWLRRQPRKVVSGRFVPLFPGK